MGAGGRPPAPTSLKLLRGEKKRDRLNFNEPIVPDGPPIDPPEFLTSEAVVVWESIAPTLQRMGLLTHIDARQFAVYCDAVAQYERASELVAKTGMLIRGRKDATVKNPAVQLLRDYAQTIARFSYMFGLSPSARSSIDLGQRDEYGRTGAERLLS
jgi:P27 family predicted phage terminase small subunit